MTIEQLLAGVFGPLGALFALALAVVAFVKGWVVPGYLFRREVDRGNEAERRAWRMAGIAEPAVRAAERLATTNERIGEKHDQ